VPLIGQATRLEFAGGVTLKATQALSFYAQAGYQFELGGSDDTSRNGFKGDFGASPGEPPEVRAARRDDPAILAGRQKDRPRQPLLTRLYPCWNFPGGRCSAPGYSWDNSNPTVLFEVNLQRRFPLRLMLTRRI
jgi:hypothetical protein